MVLHGLQAFEFDRVFGPESSQAAVFEDVAQLTTSALDGYNVCIFAYGQTGALLSPCFSSCTVLLHCLAVMPRRCSTGVFMHRRGSLLTAPGMCCNSGS